MQIVSNGDNLHELSGRNKKNITNLSSAEQFSPESGENG